MQYPRWFIQAVRVGGFSIGLVGCETFVATTVDGDITVGPKNDAGSADGSTEMDGSILPSTDSGLPSFMEGCTSPPATLSLASLLPGYASRSGQAPKVVGAEVVTALAATNGAGSSVAQLRDVGRNFAIRFSFLAKLDLSGAAIPQSYTILELVDVSGTPNNVAIWNAGSTWGLIQYPGTVSPSTVSVRAPQWETMTMRVMPQGNGHRLIVELDGFPPWSLDTQQQGSNALRVDFGAHFDNQINLASSVRFKDIQVWRCK
jgi:hypothetical protein